MNSNHDKAVKKKQQMVLANLILIHENIKFCYKFIQQQLIILDTKH